jgi:hypothetical protein
MTCNSNSSSLRTAAAGSARSGCTGRWLSELVSAICQLRNLIRPVGPVHRDFESLLLIDLLFDKGEPAGFPAQHSNRAEQDRNQNSGG